MAGAHSPATSSQNTQAVEGSGTAFGAVLLFDGVCNVCNNTVVFVIARDPGGYFSFASLQSNVGRQLVSQHGLSPDVNTIVLIEHGRAYERSDAMFRVLLRLGAGWRLLARLGLLVPRFIRDLGYRVFARYRYALFGRTEQCLVPTPDLKRRFLADS
jgi:predicted DCC family thiol-disulfide oxidoreductase YuxK